MYAEHIYKYINRKSAIIVDMTPHTLISPFFNIPHRKMSLISALDISMRSCKF